MSKETGGPAFPYSGVHHTEEMNYIIDNHGMTLRDHFAGLAMQGIVRRYNGHTFGGGVESPQYRELAEDAYDIADAMLKARGQ